MNNIERAIKLVKEMDEKATKGPWMGDGLGAFIFTQDADGSCGNMVVEIRGYGAGLPGSSNSEFIATARTEWPKMARALERAVIALKDIQDRRNAPCQEKQCTCPFDSAVLGMGSIESILGEA